MTYDWNDYQEFALKMWHSENDYKLQNNEISLEDLVADSTPMEVSDIEISISDYDVDLTFKTDFAESILFDSFAVNDSRNLLFFIESIMNDNFETYFYCEEEGPDTFFYAICYENNILNFIHISTRKQSLPFIDYEEFKVKQNIIIDKDIFVDKFAKLFISMKHKLKKMFKYEIWADRDVEMFLKELKNFQIMYNRYKKNRKIY